MRFLDRPWVERQRDTEDRRLHLQVYHRHLESIADDLPKKLRMFAELSAGAGLYRARLLKARLNRKKATLRVVLQLPTDQDDWAKVRLMFSKVDLDALDTRAWKRVCANSESTCTTDEVDLAPGGLFEHRMLFQPAGETSVTFRRMQFEIEELPDGHLEPHGGWREDA